MLERVGVRTRSSVDFIDITHEVAACVQKSGVKQGLCCIFVTHTTAAVTINENADPAVITDLTSGMDRIAPMQAGYKHAEGNSAAHIKTTLTGPSLTVIIENGRLVLGTWQSIFFCEYDGPRARTVLVKIVEG